MQNCYTSGPFFDLDRGSHAFLLMRSDLPKAGFHRSIRKKLLRAMKWTIFLMVVTTLHVSANGFSQNVKITMEERQIKLERFFRLAEKQTDYRFSYSTSLVPITLKIDVSAKDEPLVRVLERILPVLGMRYRLINKNVIGITPVSSVTLAAPVDTTITVMGRILDARSLPVESASIMVKGTRQGETTDEQGRFMLKGVSPDAIISVSAIGFATQEYPLHGKRTIEVKMVAEKAADLQEVTVVNTGYQAISRERATGSFSSINPTRLRSKLKPDIVAALEGQAAGVVVTKEGAIEVRGVSTMNAGIRDILIVVDGYPISGGLESINVDNIESITVLKDAVAASIYGARSSNGVIVITTKMGAAGKMSVEYRGSVGVVLKPELSYLNRASTVDYIDAELDLYKQDPNSYLTTYNNYGVMSRVNYLSVARAQNWISEAAYNAEIEQLKKNDGIGQLQEHLFRNQFLQQHNISLSGGSEKNRTVASLKYIANSRNVIRTDDSRVIFDVKNIWKPSSKVSVQVFANVNYFNEDKPVRTWSDMLAYTSTSLLQPYDMVVDPATGNPADVFYANPRSIDRYKAISGMKPLDYNPLEDLALENSRLKDLQIRMGGTINISLLPGLNLETGGLWTRGSSLQRTLYNKESYRMRAAYNDATSISNPSKHYIPDGDMISETRNMNEDFTLRVQLSYNKRIGKLHRIAVLGGSEVRRDIVDNNTMPTRFGYNDLAGTFLPFNYADYSTTLYNSDMYRSAGKISASSGSYSFRDNRFASFYANGSYEYDNRFLISGSARIDQTNFFGTDPKYRYKPLWSVGGTYKLSREKFFDVSWIDKLYVRGSYGVNGNISLNSGPFLIISAGSFSNLTGNISHSIASPPNNSLRWERTNTINIGTDLSFSKGRVNMSVDYYFKKSTDLLANDAIDPTRGFASLTKNVGQINNNGIEVSLNTDVMRTRDLVWNVLVNYSYNRNKVVKYNVNYQYASQLTSGSILRQDYPANALFSYRFAGLDNNGIAQFYNNNKDKVVGGNVQATDLIYSGTLRPPHAFSLTNTIRYKRFDLSFMLIAKMGNVLRKDAFTGSNYINKHVAKRWKNPGDEANTIYPKLTAWNMDMFYFPYSDVLVESANFIKMRDITLSYDMNNGFFTKAGFSDVRLQFQVRHLFMITANSDRRDPETSEINTTGGTGAFTEQGFTSLPLRPEFYIGITLGL